MNRLIGILSLVLGLLGILACLAGAYASWQAAAEARRVNEQLSETARSGMTAAEDRLRSVYEGLRTAHAAGEEISARVRELSKQEARERIAEQLQLEQRVDQLDAKIATANAWMEATNDTLVMVQKILKLGRSGGAGDEAERIEAIITTIADVRGELQKTRQQLQLVRNFGKEVDGESLDERIARILRIVAGVVAATKVLDTRVQACYDQVAAWRERTVVWEQRIDIAIRRAFAIALLILGWMAAGQWALFRSGIRRSFRSSRCS